MNDNILRYKDYYGKVEYNSEDDVLYGKVEGIADLIVYEGYSIDEIKLSFQNAVDDYLKFCKEIGKNPDKSYKGSFNVRIPPEIHKKAYIMALEQGISLNQFVTNAITSAINKTPNNVIYVLEQIEKKAPYVNKPDKNTIINQFKKAKPSLLGDLQYGY